MKHWTSLLSTLTLLALIVVGMPGAASAQPTHASYQGQLLQSGAPFTGSASFKFAVVSGVTNLWANDGTTSGQPTQSVSLSVVDGVFSVRLGDTTIAGMTTALTANLLQTTSAVLRVWVNTGSGFVQLSDVPLSSSPFALQSDGAKRALTGFQVTGDLQIFNSNATRTMFMDSADGSSGGLFVINDIDALGNPKTSLELDSREGSNGGVLRLHNGIEGGPNPNLATIEISAAEGTGAGEIVLYDNQGNVAIELDADIAGNSKITVDIVQINGGMDLSERFHIDGEADQIQSGTVVSIDPKVAGGLVMSCSPYDRRVAGIVSGAGGVQTGMILGQESSPLCGNHAVALSGRVYAWADAGHGAIEPGDLLTTSATPGHAMRVGDFARSQGAILGKAMTGLREGRGLVLVLVTLQ